MPVIGIVVALRSEAKIFGVRRIEPFAPLDLSDSARLILCGMGAAAAQRGAQQLVRSGVSGLASFGVAGALSLKLRSGDLLCPEQVIDDEGRIGAVDCAWRKALIARLGASLAPAAGTLLSSARALTDANAKRAAGIRTGAVAVDMESAAIAAVASSAGCAFVALRAIADEAHTALPQAVTSAVDVYGRVLPGRLLRNLAARPQTLFDLLALGRGFGRASASLHAALKLASTDLGWAIPSAASPPLPSLNTTQRPV